MTVCDTPNDEPPRTGPFVRTHDVMIRPNTQLAVALAVDAGRLHASAHSLDVPLLDLSMAIRCNIEEVLSRILAEDASDRRLGCEHDESRTKALVKLAVYGVAMAETIANRRHSSPGPVNQAPVSTPTPN